jgi:uncharacterized protein YbjQ (UPF0145 family)
MDTNLLVKNIINDGKKLVEALDKTTMQISSAFWYYEEDYKRWKLILASNTVNKEGYIKAYDIVLQILEDSKDTIEIPFESISIIAPQDSLNILFSSAIHTGNDAIVGIRLSDSAINGIFIDDAYLYRVNAA